jgi:hypothetical protein
MIVRQLILIILTFTIVFVIVFAIAQFFQVGQILQGKEEHSNGTSRTFVAKQEILEQETLFQVNSKPYNLTYGDWTANWWRWAYSISKAVNPAYDDTGKYCSVNQLGPVWFFPGTYGKEVVRECTVPNGKAILFPILNSECSFAEFHQLRTVEELSTCAKRFQDQVTELYTSIDGQNISNAELERYRIQSPPFSFMLPENNILGLPEDTSTVAVSDGNWVFLKPLSPGTHEISFRGDVRGHPAVNNSSSSSSSESFAFPTGWNYTTTYELVVE